MFKFYMNTYKYTQLCIRKSNCIKLIKYINAGIANNIYRCIHNLNIVYGTNST